MSRVTCTPARLARKRRLRNHAKGFRGSRSKLYKVMKETVHRAWAFAYKHRRLKKREFRSLWILRVNAAARARGLNYSRLVHGLSRAGVALDRKSLSEMAIQEPQAFDRVVEVARDALAG